ncbi:dolichyl-phosphate beta-glucosyltransferase [Patulibacter defluvii]|uniref:dolichyl-phosphate beta-glucosyltransferase n=1 Tax=Patulibacter defluvii TaxID=3095358 RepID=UPI002A75392F|nr:dolichyl-phosphate beta-glucosyltransferase [Patulibacter sp. DM4]
MPSTSPIPVARDGGAAAAPPVVEVVVPVHNEQRALPASIRRLHDHLTAALPFRWRITIADNASTDETARVARALADDLPGVALLRLPEKGRGRALRAAWTASDATVLCYMDVDLSTDLAALLPLVAPLVSGHSDVAIGTRLAPGSRVVRGPKRELISRVYNRLLHVSLAARFSDAQCGFKAIRADVARELLPQVRDEAWFFDTELLVLAQREGRRIHEVPVDWVDDPDSRVDLVATALEDLRGIGRLLAAARLTRFLAIGVLSTVAYALLFLLLRAPLGAAGANVAALAITAVANTQANRHVTFGLRGREGLARQHAMGAVVFALTVLLTSGALSALHAIDARPSRAVELTVLVAASVGATVTRYVALRSWVFARRGRAAALAAPAPSPTPTTATVDRVGG